MKVPPGEMIYGMAMRSGAPFSGPNKKRTLWYGGCTASSATRHVHFHPKLHTGGRAWNPLYMALLQHTSTAHTQWPTQQAKAPSPAARYSHTSTALHTWFVASTSRSPYASCQHRKSTALAIYLHCTFHIAPSHNYQRSRACINFASSTTKCVRSKRHCSYSRTASRLRTETPSALDLNLGPGRGLCRGPVCRAPIRYNNQSESKPCRCRTELRLGVAVVDLSGFGSSGRAS